MAISYANIQVTKVLTLRGNTIQNNRYTGLPGELTVDTEAKTIRIHDGVTPGGNVIQGASGASSYANANVKVYLTAFDGNIIPSANAVYSLGTVTNQWKSLFVSNTTIYVGGVPLSIDSTGNLTVNGNTIPTVAYVNTVVANVTVDLSSYALNANVTAANVGLKGYVDQANTIQSAQISSANVGMKGYVDQQITDLIGGAPSILDTLNEIAASINDDANVYTSLTNSIATANTALKGYVDQANTIQSTAITQANLGLKGYVDSQSFYSNTKVSTYLSTFNGNIGNLWIDSTTYNPDVWLRTRQNNTIYISPDDINHLFLPTAVSGSQLALAGYGLGGAGVFSSNSYVQLDGNGWDSGIELRTSFNSNNYTWTFSQIGNLTSPTGASITNGYPGGTIGDGQGWFVTPSGNAGGVASADGQQYVQVNNGYGVEIGTGWTGNAHVWHFGLNGNLTLPAGGTILESTYFSADSIILKPHGGTSTQYLEIAPTAVDGNHLHLMTGSGTELFLGDDNHYVKLANTGGIVVNSNDNIGNTAQWTFGIDGNLVLPHSGYLGNVWGEPSETTLVAAPGGFVAIANSSGDQYVDANDNNVLIGTNYSSGGGNVWLFYQNGWLVFPDGAVIDNGTFKAASNSSVNLLSNNEHTQVRVDNANVEIYTSPNGSTQYQWTFGTDGNITLPSNVSSINYANGISILSGLGSGYGNAQVATYLPTYTGNIAADIISGKLRTTKSAPTTAQGVTGDSDGDIAIENNFIYICTTTFSNVSSYTANIDSNESGGSVTNIDIAVPFGTLPYYITPGWSISWERFGIQTRTIETISAGTWGGTKISWANQGTAPILPTTTIFTLTSPGLPDIWKTVPLTSFETSAYGNVQVGVYTNLSTYAWNANVTAANVGLKGYVDSQTFYSNARVATYLQYGATSNISVAGNVTATYFVGNGALLTGIAASSSYSNVQVAAYLATATINTTGNITAGNLITSGALYVANITTTGASGNISGANYITANYFVGNGSQLTGLPAGYSNVQVAAYLNTQGYNLYSNVNVASYLSTATITTTGNITAQYLTGNINITGNVTGTSANVTLQAGSYSSVFDNQGNVTVPRLFANGNVQSTGYIFGNGAFLTGVVTGSSYSNVQVATYLPTYSGVVGASNVFVSGNVTAQYLFGNGSQLSGIASSYSNVQVATYLPTYTGNIANIRLGVSGVLTFADGTTLSTASAIAGSNYGNGNVASYLITNGYVNTNSAYANGNVASYLITNQYINANSAYGNGNVTSYLPTHSGNVGVNNLIGTTPNVTLQANSYSSTFDIYGNVAFGNAAYPVQIYATGAITTNSNLTVGGMGVVMPNRPAFRVNGTAAPITTANVNLKGSAITTVFNQGSYFDATTGKFTAPIAGIYEVLLNARVGTYNGLSQIAVLKNGNNSQGNIVCFWEIGSTTGTANHFGVSGTINLVAGDYLSANILAGNISFDGNDNWCVTYLG